MYDILIRNGLAFDGSLSSPMPIDIAVKDGHVAALGTELVGESARVIDAGGKYVAPGFIDPHTHSDFSLLVEPDGDSKLRQGVTTEVIGNCGESPAPAYGQWSGELERNRLADTSVKVTWHGFGQYLEQLAQSRPILNLVPVVGHNSIRGSVLGVEDRAPDPNELQKMKDLTRAAMEEGAWGLSTGLIYPPGVYARTDEVVELAQVVHEFGGFYASHVRNEARAVLAALDEALEVGERAQVPVQVAHLKVCGYRSWHLIDKLLEVVDKARRMDIPVHFDQYPYVASSTDLLVILPEWTYEGGSDAAARRLTDPQVRARLRRAMEEDPDAFWDYAGTKEWEGIVLTNYVPNREYQGKSIADIAQLLDRDPLDTCLDLLVEANCVVGCLLFDGDESNLRRIMRVTDIVMVGSDGYSVRADGYTSKRSMHPRSFGTFARVLGHYAREEKVLDWSQAIHKMTGLPARAFGLTGRGSLLPGSWADIVIFDPETVIDQATFMKPHQYPQGIDYVLVNGQIAVEDGQTTGTRAGTVLSPPR